MLSLLAMQADFNSLSSQKWKAAQLLPLDMRQNKKFEPVTADDLSHVAICSSLADLARCFLKLRHSD
jgi:hypothetical protein